MKRGGGLVASLDTALFDEFGTPRKAPALADVLGVEAAGRRRRYQRPGSISTRTSLHAPAGLLGEAQGRLGLQTQLPPHRFSNRPGSRSCIGKAPRHVQGAGRAREAQARCSGTRDRSAEGRREGRADRPRSSRICTARAGSSTSRPASTRPTTCSSYPYYRLVLAEAIARRDTAPPPVEVAAPMCVHAVTVRQKKDGERLIVHLFNDVNTTAGHGLPAEEVPLREEVFRSTTSP